MALIDFDIEAEANEIAASIGTEVARQRRAYIGKPKEEGEDNVKANSVTGLPNSYYIVLDAPDNPVFTYAVSDVYNQTQEYQHGAAIRVKPYYLDSLVGVIRWTIKGADELLVFEQFGSVGGDPADAYGNVPIHDHTSASTGGTLDINILTGVLASARGGTGIDAPATIADDKAVMVFNTATEQFEAGDFQSGGIILGADTAAPSVLNATKDGDIPEGFDTGAAFTFRIKSNNWEATTDPTVNDDETLNYRKGSGWYNNTSETLFYCKNPATGAAIWQAITEYTPPLNNMTATTDPGATDDESAGYGITSEWWNGVTLTLWTPIDVTTGAALWKQTAGQGRVPAEVTTITGDTTLDATYYTVLVDASGGNVTVTLPDVAVNFNREYNIKRIDSVVLNTVTIDGGGANIDGAGSITLPVQYDKARLQSNGTAWWLI